MFLIILCFGTLFGLGVFFLSAGLLKLPTSASTRAVMTVTSRKKESKSLDAIVMDMAFKVSKLVRLSDFKHRKLELTLKSADISMTPEVYIAKAWVKSALIGLLIIPLLLIFPLLVPVILFLAIAVYFREMKQADEIVNVKREEIEYELPRFVGIIRKSFRASRDVLSIMKAISPKRRTHHEARA